MRGVVALAPWLPGPEPVEQLTGRDLVVLHGTRDLTTSHASARFVVRAAAVARPGLPAGAVERSRHAAAGRPWHRLTAAFVAAIVFLTIGLSALALAVDAGCRDLLAGADDGMPGDRPRPHGVAAVGAGVAGLTAGYLFQPYDVTLYEAEPRLGGHAHTHDVLTPDGAWSRSTAASSCTTSARTPTCCACSPSSGSRPSPPT